jgi:hypothetical protein
MDFSWSINLGMNKGFQKSSTFPTSAGEVGQDGDSTCHADKVMKGIPDYERSLSLPPTLKPISAMKGSREKNGMASPTENCHVKWAPDVYDPPVTSVCHSVSSSYQYQRRSKLRKKEKERKEKEKREKKERIKQKKKEKMKSKKSQQNAIQNSSVLQTPDLGLEDVSASNGQSSLNGLGKHEAVILDYNISKEGKCGSSFLRESVSKMHFSIAEAS